MILLQRNWHNQKLKKNWVCKNFKVVSHMLDNYGVQRAVSFGEHKPVLFVLFQVLNSRLKEYFLI